MPDNQTYILLFDGVCNLCNGMVKFIIKRDPAKKFRFAALQSAAGKVLMEKSGLFSRNVQTVVLIHGSKYYVKSTAALLVLKELSGIWKLCYVLIVIPKPIRDFVYDIVAKTRYRVFGRQETCMVPTPEIKDRFLAQENSSMV